MIGSCNTLCFICISSFTFIIWITIVQIVSNMAGMSSSQNRNGVVYEFPKTLEDFGYFFNERGQLRQVENPELGFVFEVKANDKEYNQRRYEALGEIINEEIYKLLESKTGLRKIYVPVEAADEEARGFFFASDNAWTVDALLIIIHGGSPVRAGQWSRKLIINDDINTGSQIPYIEKAIEAGFGVVVLNTNMNRVLNSTGKDVYIRGSEDPSSHAVYVWDNFIRGATARHIAIVAHSAGGYVTVNLAHERWTEFAERVFAVAFTDSVHSAKPASPSWDHMLKVTRNWITSRLELGAIEKRHLDDVDRVSAGTLVHERTSASAIEDICNFLSKRYQAVTSNTEKTTDPTDDQVEPKSTPVKEADAEQQQTIGAKVNQDTSNGLVDEADGQEKEL